MAVRRLFMAGVIMMALTWMFEVRAEAPRALLAVGDQIFAASDIVDARAQPEPDGSASILITFETEAAARLNRLRMASKGTALPLMLGSRLLASPVVDDQNPGDVLLIPGGFSREDAVRIALAISGKPPLPESLDEEE